MYRYLIRRIALSAATLLVILLVLFAMLQLLPGSPFNDERLSREQIAQLYETYGLDQPFFQQFFRYVGNMLRGDFGISYAIQSNMPISVMIAARFPVTMRIGLQSAVLGTLVGLVLGVAAALKKGTALDSIATGLSVLGVSLPSFVFALALSYFFGYKLRWFPILYDTKQEFVSSILPTVALSMFTVASIARYARSEVIEVLQADYIQLAVAKGVPRARVVAVHVLRNALIGVITVLAPLVVNLMTGSLVVEKAFSIPGLGSLYITAIQSNDYNVVLTISFLYSALFIGVMLLVDILYSVIDPRVRLGR